MLRNVDTDRKLCSGVTAEGLPCQGRALEDGLCWAHTPTLEAKRAAAYAEGGAKSGARRRYAWATEAAGGLQTPAEILAHLEDVVRSAKAQSASSAAMNVVISACRVSLAVLEGAEFEERLAELEVLLSKDGRE